MDSPAFFPKTHKSFVDDPVTLRAIAAVEDCIELRYQASSMKTALEPFKSLFVESVSARPKFPMPQDLLEDLELIVAMSGTHEASQLDMDRDAIWEIKNRCGSLYVMGFLEPKLLTSLEILFSGVVVGYFQMFNDTKTRLRLEYTKVFKGFPGLGEFHVGVVKSLRNNHYAHKNSAEGQQSLMFFINESNEIFINQEPSHYGFEFYPDNYENLYRCVCQVINYLDGEISILSANLLGGLNESQLAALQGEWVIPRPKREFRDPMSYREPKAKILKGRKD